MEHDLAIAARGPAGYSARAFEIGDVVRKWRELKGLTQKGLADTAKVSPNTIWNIEQGKPALIYSAPAVPT